MTDIAVINYDIGVTESGDIGLVFDDNDIIQECIMNMSIVYGELPNQPTRGNKAFARRLKMNASGIEQLKYDCKNAMLYSDRISDVTEIAITPIDYTSVLVEFKVKLPDDRIIGNNAILNM